MTIGMWITAGLPAVAGEDIIATLPSCTVPCSPPLPLAGQVPLCIPQRLTKFEILTLIFLPLQDTHSRLPIASLTYVHFVFTCPYTTA
ncbi:hypothetical protein E2C01_061371 [Portunus trituberculatus]|uniref:Secreted protein n=1 Tax=Portunus trituberculatus TaxID=210409 RepID=A0A5B7HEV6_PORTR|nr:hypothetical protein [Portunus trituberculatus]